MDIHISVRNLVEFILRSGDIDNRKAVAPENAMQEGFEDESGRHPEVYVRSDHRS